MRTLLTTLTAICAALAPYQAANAQQLPTLDGFGAASFPTDFLARFPSATCSRTQFTMGAQKSESVMCSTKAAFLGRASEYKASFGEGGMSGLAIHVLAPNDALRLAPELVRSLSSSYGVPTDNFVSSPETMRREGGVGARWIFRPTALATLTLCGPSLYVDRVGCPDNRIIIDLMYNHRRQ